MINVARRFKIITKQEAQEVLKRSLLELNIDKQIADDINDNFDFNLYHKEDK